MTFENILVAGYGTITGAMVDGWLAAGIPANRFTLYNPRVKTAPEGVRFTTAVPDAPCDAVVLGFKPHMLAEVAPALLPAIGLETVILSVLAGVDCSSLRAAFPDAAAWVRFMPNLAFALNKSATILWGEGLKDGDRAKVAALAEAGGGAEWLADERHFDLATALAGSGPGFTYRYIAALAEAAASLGLEAALAERLAVQMVEGAGALAAGSPHSPDELARRVASPGGMTQKGLDVLDADKALVELTTRCLAAATERGAEMAADARRRSE